MIPPRICLKVFLCITLLLLTRNKGNSQERIITAGFQYKPLFSGGFFNTGTVSVIQNKVNFSIAPNVGFCGGMVIRRGFASQLSLETGINFTKRNYQLTIADADSTFNGTSSFSITAYEIPLEGLVFIKLGEKLFMDAAAGISLSFFPSDIYTFDTYFKHYSSRKSWIQPNLLANIGYEYRTDRSGYFYIGASYLLPFFNIYNSKIEYDGNVKRETVSTKLSGNYLSIDFRYFFHAPPMKKKKVKKNQE